MKNEDIKKFRRRTNKIESRRKIRDYSVEIISAVIVGVLVTTIVSVFSNNVPFIEEKGEQEQFSSTLLAESSSSTHRSIYIRAMLVQVLSHTSLAKMHITEYFMSTGELPKNIQDIGMSAMDFQEIELIEDFYLTKEGGIGVALSSDFGNQKLLILHVKVLNSGSMLHWRCETNVEKKHLGVPRTAMCNYNAGLEII